MYIRNRVYSRLLSLGIVSIRDRVHSGWCQLDCIHSGWCPFGILSTKDSILREYVFRDRVHSGHCPNTSLEVSHFSQVLPNGLQLLHNP